MWDPELELCLYPGYDQFRCDIEVPGGIYEQSQHWVLDIFPSAFSMVWEDAYGAHWMWPVHD